VKVIAGTEGRSRKSGLIKGEDHITVIQIYRRSITFIT
jgi:hypothetical protein